MSRPNIYNCILRSLGIALILTGTQAWVLGMLSAGAMAACFCLYFSLILIAQLGDKTVVLPLFIIPVWWMHYVPAPQLAKRGLVDYWFCRLYLQDLNWQTNYELTCWALVPLTIGLVLPLVVPGFLTARQLSSSWADWRKRLTLSPYFENFCLVWLVVCILADALRLYSYAGPLRQPVSLVIETRLIAMGTLLLLGRPKAAIAGGLLGFGYELVLASTSGLFAGLFDRVLPVLFLLMFRWRWRWLAMLAVIGFFAALYVNEVEKQTVYRVKLRQGELSGPIDSVFFLGDLWLDLVMSPKELFSMETRSNFFARMDNQFYIQNALMSRIPSEVPHYSGKRVFGVVENFLPRIIHPNKPDLLDRKEFTYLTGHPLQEGTSMGYGPSGEFYIDYGLWGLYIGMLFYGLAFGLAWRLFHHLGDENPAWWPWFCYLFGMWITQIGAMMIMITGRTIKGAIILIVLVWAVPQIRDMLALPSRRKERRSPPKPVARRQPLPDA